MKRDTSASLFILSRVAARLARPSGSVIYARGAETNRKWRKTSDDRAPHRDTRRDQRTAWSGMGVADRLQRHAGVEPIHQIHLGESGAGWPAHRTYRSPGKVRNVVQADC